MDGNVQIEESAIIRSVLQTGFWYDAVQTLAPDSMKQQATYQATRGSSRIDYIFYNRYAKDFVQAAALRHDATFRGHATVQLTLRITQQVPCALHWDAPAQYPAERAPVWEDKVKYIVARNITEAYAAQVDEARRTNHVHDL